MLAIDTNIVVRYLVGDGGEQFGRAVGVMEGNEVSISLTVVLETECVLREAYELTRDDVLAALRKVFGLPTVSVRDEQVVRNAMNLAAAGMDFPDALHVAQSSDCAAFVTFDKRLVRRGKGSTHVSIRSA